MPDALWWAAAAACAPIGYVVVVTLGIGVVTLIASVAGARVPQDAVQQAAFEGVGAGPLRRLRGLAIEGFWQAIAFAKQALHALGWLSPPPRRPGHPPVVVLPGYTENAGTMHSLGRRLGQAGYDPILLDFPSTFSPVRVNADWLGKRLAALCEELGVDAIPVVAHSMGGLITRTLVHCEPDNRVAALVAIASPFRGTEMARLAAMVRGGLSSYDMTPSSRHVAAFPPTDHEPVPILSIVAFQEDIIAPPWNSVLPGADNVVLDEPYGHEAPLFVESAFRHIERFLAEYRAAPASQGAGEHVLHHVDQEQDRQG